MLLCSLAITMACLLDSLATVFQSFYSIVGIAKILLYALYPLAACTGSHVGHVTKYPGLTRDSSNTENIG